MTQGCEKLNVEPVANRKETNLLEWKLGWREEGQAVLPRIMKALGREVAKVTEPSKRWREDVFHESAFWHHLF